MQSTRVKVINAPELVESDGATIRLCYAARLRLLAEEEEDNHFEVNNI